MQADQMEIRRTIEARLVERAAEPSFRELLLKDPRAAVEKAAGRPLPGSVKVRVVEAPADTLVLVVPAASTPGGELDDAQLERVAGGGSMSQLSQVLKTIGEGLSTVARKG